MFPGLAIVAAAAGAFKSIWDVGQAIVEGKSFDKVLASAFDVLSNDVAKIAATANSTKSKAKGDVQQGPVPSADMLPSATVAVSPATEDEIASVSSLVSMPDGRMRAIHHADSLVA